MSPVPHAEPRPTLEYVLMIFATSGDANSTLPVDEPCENTVVRYPSRADFDIAPFGLLTFELMNSTAPPTVACGLAPVVVSERGPQNRDASMSRLCSIAFLT